MRKSKYILLTKKEAYGLRPKLETNVLVAPQKVKQKAPLNDSDAKLMKLLQKFNLEQVFSSLTTCGITYVNKDDLDTVLPETNFYLEAKNFPETPTTISEKSKGHSWVQSQNFCLSQTPTSSRHSFMTISNVNIKDVLKASLAGQRLLSVMFKGKT